MDKWCVLVDPGQVVVDVLLGGGVAPEVDSSRRSHPDQVWSQTSVHPSDSLVGPDMPEVESVIKPVLPCVVLLLT